MQEVVKNIQTKIKQLERAETNESKIKLITEIADIKQQMVEMIEKMPDGYHKERHRKQIKDVDGRIKKHSNLTISNYEPSVCRQQQKEAPNQRRPVTSEQVIYKIVQKEISSKDLKLTPQEIEKVHGQMIANIEVMNQIAQIVKETGDNIEQLDSHIENTYNNTKIANKELNEANTLAISTRIMKVRLFASTFFAAIGHKLFGFFGMIGGLFAGYKTGSVLKE